METNSRSTLVGVFEEPQQANRAVEELRAAGFRDDQIGVAAKQSEGRDAVTIEHHSMWTEGAVAGALTGAGLGGLVGLGVLAGVIPIVGPILVGGTLAVILANVAGGATIAGLAGALIGAGLPEEEAHYYESEFHAGRTIVTVEAGPRYDEAVVILARNGAHDLQGSGAPT